MEVNNLCNSSQQAPLPVFCSVIKKSVSPNTHSTLGRKPAMEEGLRKGETGRRNPYTPIHALERADEEQGSQSPELSPLREKHRSNLQNACSRWWEQKTLRSTLRFPSTAAPFSSLTKHRTHMQTCKGLGSSQVLNFEIFAGEKVDFKWEKQRKGAMKKWQTSPGSSSCLCSVRHALTRRWAQAWLPRPERLSIPHFRPKKSEQYLEIFRNLLITVRY